jgi:addiction module RelE/StbE family toxin
MAYKLAVSKDAHRDVDEIAGYIAHELKNTRAAAGFLDDVERSYRGVVENPLMYGLCGDERLHRGGYRKIVIKHYLIIYRVDEAKKTVFVVRVVYGARDYGKLL